MAKGWLAKMPKVPVKPKELPATGEESGGQPRQTSKGWIPPYHVQSSVFV